MKKSSVLRKINISVAIALIICIAMSLTGFEASCEDLRQNVLRLHILANSDKESDQALKLKVRDAVIEKSGITFESCTDLNDAITAAQNSLEDIKKTAESVIKDNGYDYPVSVTVDKEYFNTRIYDEFTLPAGFYNSLIIRIGEAKGKNWWCVIFPALCVSASFDGEFKERVGDGGTEIAENAQKYQVRFKIVEYYQNFKKNILNK